MNYTLLSEEELRSATVALHMTQGRIDELTKKYRASVDQDDVWWSELAASRLAKQYEMTMEKYEPRPIQR